MSNDKDLKYQILVCIFQRCFNTIFVPQKHHGMLAFIIMFLSIEIRDSLFYILNTGRLFRVIKPRSGLLTLYAKGA